MLCGLTARLVTARTQDLEANLYTRGIFRWYLFLNSSTDVFTYQVIEAFTAVHFEGDLIVRAHLQLETELNWRTAFLAYFLSNFEIFVNHVKAALLLRI